MKKVVSKIGVGACLLGLSAFSNASMVPFDLTVNFDGGLTTGQQEAFIQAEAFWESTILGYQDDIRFQPGITITAKGESIDGAGGILGSAGPTYIGKNNQPNAFTYATAGTMRFDSADLNSMESNGTLLSVIKHEMAHVIGFGSLWDLNGLYIAGTGEYTGTHANDAYRIEFDSTATYLPVELDGGQGTADAHFDENWAGPQSDIMTGYIEGPVTISDTTIASFRDLGYVTKALSYEISDVPAPFYIGALSLFGLMLNRRNK